MPSRWGERLARTWRALGLGRRPPDVVWICADDFAGYACGAYGDPRARTPNIDRLASEGLRFDRAYCNCPLSTPSRQAFLTGRYPRSLPVTLSPTPLPDREVTLATLLRRAGYEAAAFGKTHYYAPLHREFPTHVDLPEHREWLERKGSDPLPPGVPTLGPWLPFHDPARVWLNADALPYPATDAEMSGTFFAGLAADVLRSRRRADPPLFLAVNFYETHSPYRFPVEYHGRRRPEEFDPPEPGPEDRDRIPRVFADLTPADKRGILAANATAVEFMDRNVGRVLDAIDRAGRRDSTFVVFGSDHGYFLGHHGRFEKHCCHEAGIRVALVLRYPPLIRPGTSSAALVELIDVVPTILDLIGAPVPADVHGRSLLPLLRGERSRHRRRVFVEYADNAEAAVVTDRWKLIYEAGNRRRRDGYALDRPPSRSVRLYDLASDPGEATDLAGRPEQARRVAAMLALLAGHVRRTEPEPSRLPETSDLHALLAAALPPRERRD